MAVAEESHFRKAAEHLCMTQPALSRQIQRLEEELGVQLFVRDRRKVALTDAGRAFLEEARAVLERVDLAQTVARRAARGQTGSLSIGYSPFFIIPAAFPEAVRLYRERFPDVALQMHDLYPAEQVRELLEGEIDVGLVWLPIDDGGLHVETLLEEAIVAALPANHPLACNAQVVLEDLAQEPFVFFPRWEAPGYHDLITGTCREADFIPEVVVEANSMQGMASMVATGIGVSLMPVSASEVELKKPMVVYKEIAQLEVRVEVGLARRSEEETPVLKRFLEVAREVS